LNNLFPGRGGKGVALLPQPRHDRGTVDPVSRKNSERGRTANGMRGGRGRNQ
jgi:hypothetical protein